MKTRHLVILIILLVLMPVYFFIFTKFTNGWKSNYSRLNSNSHVNGIVEKVMLQNGTVFTTLKNSQKFCLSASRNYQYHPIYLDEFLTMGDSVSKLISSDTLFIFKNQTKYYFIIDRDVNK